MIDEKKLIERIKQEPTDGMYTHEIIEAINEQPKIGEWIPCNKHLPEEQQNIIACFIHGTVTELTYYSGNFHGMYDYNTEIIVAWQPLPEPYKKEDS